MINQNLADRILSMLLPYSPSSIGVFGSYARNEYNAGSDIDILISFKNQITLMKIVQIEQELSDKLGLKVDLVTVNSLKNPRLKESIYQDLITIFNEEKRSFVS